MKKFFSYVVLLSLVISQTYFTLPPIQMSARDSFKELGRAEAYYEVIIYRKSTPKFIIDHALDRYVRARDNCGQHQHIYIQKLIGHTFTFQTDSRNLLVKESVRLFEQIKLYFMYRRLMKKSPSTYQRLLDTSLNKEEIQKLSNPDFIRDKFL